MTAKLGRRPLDRYFLYRALAMSWAFMPFQVFFLEARGLSLASIFDLNVVFSLATVALEVPTGIYADRYGRRVAMGMGGFAMVLSCGFFVLGGGFWVYALANVLSALSMTLSSGADSAYLYDHLADSRQTTLYVRYEGLSTAAKGIGNLLAVLVAGGIYAAWPPGVFLFTALLTGAAGVLALGLPEKHHRPRIGSIADDLRRALRALRDDTRLLAVLCFGALTFVMFRISLFADQPHLELHLSGAWAAHLAAAAALLQAGKEVGSALVASMTGGIFQRARPRVIVPLLAAFVVGTYAVLGLDRAPLCLALMVLLSSMFGLFSPLMRTLMNKLIPGSRDRATLLSFESMGRRLLFAAASPLFGRAAEASSLHSAFTGTAWVAAGLYVVLGLGAVGAFRARRSAGGAGSALASVPV